MNTTGIRRVDVTISGISLLVVHAFAEKAKKEIRDKQAKKAKRVKPERDTQAESDGAKYLRDGESGPECVPITAIKKAIVSAATAFDDLTKVGLRQAIFVDSLDNPGGALAPIVDADGKPMVGEMREDAVTIGINTRGLAYRPEYPIGWRVRLRVEFNSRLVSEEQLLALIDQAGWGVGICEGRPERSSALGWGRFERVKST